MAENRTLNTRLRLKYDTAANWATKNPVLLAGEVGIESDTLLGKVGDGEKAWQQLEYLKAGSGAVRFDIVQSLTNEQKAQARTNIGASGSDTGATSVETTGSGNAFTAASYNASTRKITFTKGTTFLTAHQAIKTLKTDNAVAQSPSSSEAIAGSGTINLHKVSKTGSYNDLLNKLTAGSNITISEKNVISAKDTTYTFTADNPTLAWNTKSKIGTIGGVEFNVTMPANPNTDTGATSVEVTGTGNAVTTASYSASNRKLTLTKGATFLTTQDISGLMPKSGGTFTGEVKFGSTENFQGYYIKRMIGSLDAGTAYNNLDSKYKDGTWHRMWRLRFPSGSNFWGKIKITLYGTYSSFNASGVMSKSITCNFNTSNIYNNVGCYDGLGVNVEKDFRISEAIWNATANAWEVLIWQKNLNGNNSPTIMLECWTTNNTKHINAFNGIAAQPVELTQSTSYSAQKASSTGGTKTVTWATLPVYENPLGEEIATVAMLKNKQDKITSNNKLSASLVSDLAKVATSGSYNDLLNKPTKLSDFTDDKVVKFTNTTVAASAFVADTNYSNYGYCASISLSGVTANDTADIYFSGKQVEQEIYASFCESYAGGVKIYAAEKPSEAVIIPLILIHK